MDIRLLGENDIPKAKALWKEAFGDSDAFINWYFANKIMPGNSPAMFDKGVLVSVVHMIPLKISVQGVSIESMFIAGAATAKSRRGEGLMKTLLLESLKLMRERGIAITHLHPFKHSFYENFGWATYSYVRRLSAKTAFEALGQVVETDDESLLAPLYDGMMSGFDGYVVRGKREWRWRLEELMTDGGKAALLLKDGRPSAYMLYGSHGGEAQAAETVYSEEEDIQPLLAHVLKAHNGVNYFVPARSADESPYGMARIVDAEAFLSMFGAKETLSHIRITDAFAPWNNVGEGADVSVTQLAKAAHQGAAACFADGGSAPCYNILKKVFLYRGTCIFEQY